MIYLLLADGSFECEWEYKTMFLWCGGRKKWTFVAFHGFISDFIDNCMELTNNKLPRNDSGGDGISSENKDSLSHTELHRTVTVIPGIEKNKKEIIIVTCSFRTAACGIFWLLDVAQFSPLCEHSGPILVNSTAEQTRVYPTYHWYLLETAKEVKWPNISLKHVVQRVCLETLNSHNGWQKPGEYWIWRGEKVSPL